MVGGPEPPYGEPIRVLICDDERDIRLLYRTAFELAGTDVDVALDGAECVAAAEAVQPSLIVLDLMMPRHDGFYALTQLHDRMPDSHVVVVTAYPSPENLARAQALGAEACFDKMEFLGRIPELVKSYAPAA